MVDKMLGSWKLDSQTDFGKFMKELGVGAVWRKIGESSSPSLKVTRDNGEWEFYQSTLLHSSRLKFKLGEEFDETRADGVKVRAVVTEDGHCFLHKQFGGDGGKDVLITRCVDDDGKLIVKCKVGDVEATRVFIKTDV